VTDHLGGRIVDISRPTSDLGAPATAEDVAWAADACPLPVIVKGIVSGADADLAIEAGAAGIVVSNHGGRQMEGAVPTAVALPEVVEAAAGRVPVIVDGGIRSGVDILRALALGATAASFGRPTFWALASGGEAGVTELLEAIRFDLLRAMVLAGTPNVAAVSRPLLRERPW
jgi:4-hydroxymandelate oxidase